MRSCTRHVCADAVPCSSFLQSLGFSAYSEELNAALEAWKAEDKAATQRRAKLKGKSSGMSDEEAIAEQQRLFAAARARCYADAQPPSGAS